MQNQDIHQKILHHIAPFDHIIWDWNGTLIDDVDTAVQCINKLLPLYNASIISTQKYREIFDFPVRKYYDHLGLDLEKNSFEEIRDQYVKDYNTNILIDSKLFPGTAELLKEISTNKKQYILSAVSQWHLDKITAHFKVENLFLKRLGASDHYASGKLSQGQKLLQEFNISPEKAILIGDTIHDFEVSKELGINCLLLADGHQSYERLIKFTPHVLMGRRTYTVGM